MRQRRRVNSALMGALLAGTLALPLGGTASGQDCRVQLPDKVPVLLVHGINPAPGFTNSGPEGMKPTGDALCALPGVYVDYFDYRATAHRWVTDPSIGPRLADRIRELADRSRADGVIVIGHSMGGLAARAAAGEVGDRISFAITIGTPHEGSLWARLSAPGLAVIRVAARAACQYPRTPGWILEYCAWAETTAAPAMAPHSSELDELPDFPSDTPVLTIAARYLGASWDFFGRRVDFGGLGDMVVGARSATAAANRIGNEGGEEFIDCLSPMNLVRAFTERSPSPPPALADCLHTRLPSSGPVIGHVMEAVEQWLADHPVSPAPSDDGDEEEPTDEPPTPDPEELLESLGEEWAGTSAEITYSVFIESPFWTDEGTLVLAWRPPDAFRMDYELQLFGGTITLIAVRGEGMYFCQGSGGDGWCISALWADPSILEEVPFAELFSGPEVLLREIEAALGGTAVQVTSRTIAGFSASCFSADVPGFGGSQRAEWCFSGNGILLYLAATDAEAGIYARMEATSVTDVADTSFEPPFPVR